MKYVLVTGGVVSGLGKGVTASSIGVVLKASGLRVTSIKIGLLLLFVFKIFSFLFLNFWETCLFSFGFWVFLFWAFGWMYAYPIL